MQIQQILQINYVEIALLVVIFAQILHIVNTVII